MNEQELNIVVEHYENDELAAANEALADAYFSIRGENERVVAENEELREFIYDLIVDEERGHNDDRTFYEHVSRAHKYGIARDIEVK